MFLIISRLISADLEKLPGYFFGREELAEAKHLQRRWYLTCVNACWYPPIEGVLLGWRSGSDLLLGSHDFLKPNPAPYHLVEPPNPEGKQHADYPPNCRVILIREFFSLVRVESAPLLHAIGCPLKIFHPDRPKPDTSGNEKATNNDYRKRYLLVHLTPPLVKGAWISAHAVRYSTITIKD